jgi:hypothetical protein
MLPVGAEFFFYAAVRSVTVACGEVLAAEVL